MGLMWDPARLLKQARALRAAILDAKPEPLLKVAARYAFWSLGVSYLRRLRDLLGDVSDNDLFSVLEVLVRSILDIAEAEVLEILRVRLRHMVPRSSALVEELADHEEILAAMSKDEQKDMQKHIKDNDLTASARSDFLAQWKKRRLIVAGCKSGMATASYKKDTLKGIRLTLE